MARCITSGVAKGEFKSKGDGRWEYAKDKLPEAAQFTKEIKIK